METGLGAIFVAWIWLVPNHQLPWASFHHEVWTGLVLVLAALLMGWQTKYRFQLPKPALLLLVLALLPFLQWVTGAQPKWGQAVIASAYLLAVSLAIVLGYTARRNGSSRLIEILFFAVLIAAVLNMPIQVIQWMQWYQLDLNSFVGFFVTPIPEVARPSGNLLQPNQLATLQVWGLLVLTWLLMRESIGWKLLVPGVLVLVSGIALTQSRTGFVEIIIAGTCMVWWAHQKRRIDIGVLWVAIPVLLAVFSVGIGHVAEGLGAAGVSASRLSASDGGRLEAYLVFLRAALERPWLGFGIGDVGYAYVLLAQQYADQYSGIRFLHSHNAIIDLVLWVGFPVALLVILLTLRWFAGTMKADWTRPDLLIPMLLLLTFGLHAMLELPHHYLYFLMPVGVAVGWLSWKDGEPQVVSEFGRGGWFIASFFGALILFGVVFDYSKLQVLYTDWRYEQKKIGEVVRKPIPVPLLLNQIADELILYRARFDKAPDAETLKFVNATAAATPTPPAFFAAAVANGLAGDSGAALAWMARLNAVVPLENHKQAVAAWKQEQERHPTLRTMTWPVYLPNPQ